MISLLITCLVILIVCAILGYIVRLLVPSQPWQNIGLAIVALIGLVVILQRTGVLNG